MSVPRRSLLLSAAGVPAILALASCNRGGSEGGGQKKIALVSKGFQHQFWQAVKAGAEEAAKKNNVSMTFDGPAAETDVDGQLQMLQTAIDKHPDAIGYAALDPEACVPLYTTAEQAKIPIVEFDAGCSSDYPKSLCATDSKVAGALAAEHMAEALGGTGQVGVVGHSQINSTGVERRDGFLDYMKDKAPGIEVVDVQYGDGDHLKSADIAKAMINAHPDLKGLYGTNEGSAIGIVDAAKELGLNGDAIKIVGFDSGSAQQEAIRNGLMLGAITQDPKAIGRITIESALKVINGEKVEKFIDTGSYWYDKSNIDTPEMQERLYS